MKITNKIVVNNKNKTVGVFFIKRAEEAPKYTLWIELWFISVLFYGFTEKETT